MLKTTESLNMSGLEVDNGNGKVVEFGIGSSSGKKLTTKSGKLLKSLKLSKSRN